MGEIVNQNQHVLLIDDDLDLTRLVSRYLTENGFSVDILNSGDGAVEKILLTRPSIIILDLMLPGEDGFSICRRIREHYDQPILMLTALGDDIDQVAGLELGADDYVTKPISPRVLLSRIRALLRRHEREESKTKNSSQDSLSGLVLDPKIREVSVNGELLQLTTAEFDLLYYFTLYEGIELSRERLYRALYKREYDGADRSLDLLISRLRKKIGNPQVIKTVRGRGYLYSGKIV